LGRTALEFQLGLALPFALGLFEEPSRPCSIAQRQRGAHQGNHWWQFIAEQLSNITAGNDLEVDRQSDQDHRDDNPDAKMASLGNGESAAAIGRARPMGGYSSV